jgi:hypothetical protein
MVSQKLAVKKFTAFSWPAVRFTAERLKAVMNRLVPCSSVYFFCTSLNVESSTTKFQLYI